MYLLVLLNIIGMTIILYKIFILQREKTKIKTTASSIRSLLSEEKKETPLIFELCKQELASHMNTLEKGLNTIKIISSISPLLGLLGTVIGILMSFQMMASTGSNDITSFANGISMALLTTVGGLIVSIPHYVAYSYFISSFDTLEGSLEREIFSTL